MTKELSELDRYEHMNAVVQLYLKGRNPTEIAKELGYKRVEVVGYVDEWKQLAKDSDALTALAREAVLGSAQHYNMLIGRLWEVINLARDGGELRNETAALKIVGELEEKRINFLQKAGLLDDAALGDEIADMEEKSQAIKALLQHVVTQFPETQDMIMRGLSSIFNQPVSVELPDA